MLALAQALLAFGTAVAAHAVVARITPASNRVVTFIIAGSVCGVALLTCSLAAESPLDDIVSSVILYALLCELYIFCFTFVTTSVSANILLLLRQGPESEDRLKNSYSGHQMALLRLERLCQSRLLQQQSPGTWVLTENGRSMANLFLALRRLFRHSE